MEVQVRLSRASSSVFRHLGFTGLPPPGGSLEGPGQSVMIKAFIKSALVAVRRM